MILIRRLCLPALCTLLGVGGALDATPQILSLDSGERVVGDVLPKSTGETIFIQSGLLGEIAISRKRVVKLEPKPELKPEPEIALEAVKPEEIPESAVAQPEAQIALTQEEIQHIEERRVIDTLREIKAPDSWEGNLRLGLNLSEGDNKWTETYARGNLEIKPPDSSNFYRFTGSVTYRESQRSDGSSFKSTDRYDASFIYRRSFYENWFVQNSLGGRVDRIKGIEHEVQDAVGVGYKYQPGDDFEFLFGGGGGVEDFQADFEDTRQGVNPLVNIFQEVNWTLWERTSLVQKFNYYWNPEQSEQFNFVLSAAIRFRLTDLLGLEFSFNKDFDNDVGNGNSKDDTQWRNALVVYF